MKHFPANNNMRLTEQEFVQKYMNTGIYTEAYLKAYYAWMHREGSWENVVAEYAKTKACENQYPDLYKKYNSHSPPASP